MNRETRDKFASGTDQADLTSGNACWETSPAVFDKLSRDFGPFDVDICADATRALRPVYFGPGSPYGTDALRADWQAFGSRGYCNPPYGAFIGKILPKAKDQAVLRDFTSVFLIPMRVTVAFKRHILSGASELLFVDRRLIFWENGAPRYTFDKKAGKMRDKPDAAMFDSIVVIYRPGVKDEPRVGVWTAPSIEEQAMPRNVVAA